MRPLHCARCETPVLRDSGLSATMPRGNPSGEEVRDGPHTDNRSGGNRCGVAPTTAPLRSQAGPGLSGSGLYTVLGRAFLTPLLAWLRSSYPTSSVPLRFTPLKRCSGAFVVRSCPSPVGWAQLFPKRGNNFFLFAAPATLIGSELSVYLAPAL